MSGILIRVDRDVYRRILETKHRLERERSRRVSMREAARAALEEAGAWPVRMRRRPQRAQERAGAAGET